MAADFEATLTEAYGFDAPGLGFGAAMRGEEAVASVQVQVPLELTALGTGEALITALDLKGRPMPTVRTMMRPLMSLMAQVAPGVVDAVVGASTIVPTYLTDADPESAKELLAARMAPAAAEAKEPMEGVDDPESADERRMRPTRAPERGVDWGDAAQEGARFARSGTFNTILRSIPGILTRRR